MNKQRKSTWTAAPRECLVLGDEEFFSSLTLDMVIPMGSFGIGPVCDVSLTCAFVAACLHKVTKV